MVTGFEPLDLLEGIAMAVRQLEDGRAEVQNQYARAVRRTGNTTAQDTIAEVFQVTTRTWRGIGAIPASGLTLAEPYTAFDAERRFAVTDLTTREHPECIAGHILRGTRLPTDCAAYGTTCTPRNPLGAPMVSAEGTCAAFHAAGRRRPQFISLASPRPESGRQGNRQPEISQPANDRPDDSRQENARPEDSRPENGRPINLETR